MASIVRYSGVTSADQLRKISKDAAQPNTTATQPPSATSSLGAVPPPMMSSTGGAGAPPPVVRRTVKDDGSGSIPDPTAPDNSGDGMRRVFLKLLSCAHRPHSHTLMHALDSTENTRTCMHAQLISTVSFWQKKTNKNKQKQTKQTKQKVIKTPGTHTLIHNIHLRSQLTCTSNVRFF